MQLKRNIDWQIRKLLRKHPVPSHQLKEELWKGIAGALDKQQPVRRTSRGLLAGAAALFLVGSAAGVYFFANNHEPVAQSGVISQKQTLVSASPDLNTNAGEDAVKALESSNLNREKKFTRHIQKRNPEQESIVANIEFAGIVPERNDEIINEKLAEAKEAMKAVSLRGQKLGFVSAGSPLLAQDVKHRKKNKAAAERNGAAWASVFLNIWDNPAYTGASGKLAFSFEDNMSFFDYWRNGIYRDYFAADGRIPKTPFSVGVYHDRAINAYSMKTATAFTTSARVLPVGSGYVSIGMGVSRLSKRFFRPSGNIHFYGQEEPTLGLKEVTRKRTFTTLNTALSLEAGAWYQGKNLLAGVAVKNANEPQFGYMEQGERLEREWQFTGGYRLGLGKFQLMPLIEIEHNNLFNQASASILTTFDDKISFGGALQNISPVTMHSDKVVYAGAKVCNAVTFFTSYGRNGEMAAKGINRHIIQTGLRFQLP
jgi:hypothetical protein